MRTRTARETGILCAAGVAALALLMIPLEVSPGGIPNTHAWLAILVPLAAVAGLGMVLAFRYLSTHRRAQLELAGSEQYRSLAEEYRRLADLAITAQEHTDLKLGDVAAQLDYLREQNASMQRILSQVE
ncbi:MAG TPA: hypothetical protein VGM79_20510 [Streptosporangiaceae bacterium]|jgi:hypothetical protein